MTTEAQCKTLIIMAPNVGQSGFSNSNAVLDFFQRFLRPYKNFELIVVCSTKYLNKGDY